MELYSIYHSDIPSFLEAFAQTPAVQRLKGVGMNCGCEYTSFPLFRYLPPYSRYDHSVGVALIVWHFTQDRTQTVAGLLHDIATPVFAHVVDFMNRDYLKQESTEAGTAERISGSAELQELLRTYAIAPADVYDYHQYPVADNDSPRLSADRLEYSLGNMLNFGFCPPDTVRQIYADLTIGKNEEGQDEIMFRTLPAAEAFAALALECSRVYVSDADRYAMQMLSEILRGALERGVIAPGDLYATEPEVIEKFRQDRVVAAQWDEYCALSKTIRTDAPADRRRRIVTKKRFIDPMVDGCGRVSRLSAAFGQALEDFTHTVLDYWVCGSAE